MPQEVLKSVAALFDNFGDLVQQYADELNSHDKHMDLVAEHAKARDSVPPEQRAHPYPPPQAAAPAILGCVKKTKVGYVPDYVLVDRLRVADGTLRARQNELLNEISLAENAALVKLHPPGKWRAHNYRHKDIIDADAKRRDALNAGRKPEDGPVTLEAVLKGRPAEDHAFAQEHEARHGSLDAILRHAAGLMSEVEDLTEQNLHEWQMKPFPEN